jgi:hypothetical protein
MKITTTILMVMLFILGTNAQEIKLKGSHGGDIINLTDFSLEMVKENYICPLHQEISGQENDTCIKCNGSLKKVQKIKFYLLDNNLNAPDISNLEGRVRVVLKDETASSRKIRIDNDVMWIPLGNAGFNNYQYAVVKIRLNNKNYEGIFGHPIIHNGHHH